MADDLDNMLEQRAGADGADVDALLDARASSAPVKEGEPTPLAPGEREAQLRAIKQQLGSEKLPWYDQVARGFEDPLRGAGQLLQHVVPDAALNAVRGAVVDPAANAVAGLFGGAPKDTSHTSSADFDRIIRREEGAYQGERANAGQKGLDWARIAGNVANPVTWLGGGEAQGVKQAIVQGAKTGAFQALLQPVTSSNNFWYDKTLQAATGAVTGGALGGALASMKPLWALAKNKLGALFGQADDVTRAAAATRVTDDALRQVGADPARVDQPLYEGMKREVQDALHAGVEPDPVIMANRADALALPVPVNLTRGQASGNAAQFSSEVNTSKLQGVGEPIAARLDETRRALTENLNQLGASNASSTFDASQQVIDKIGEIDNGLRQGIKSAYDKVRDSAGRPAQMDGLAFVREANTTLGDRQLNKVLERYAPEVSETMRDIAYGRQPLTVNTYQELDRVWNGLQRAASKKGDNEAALAIGIVRDSLNRAPVSDTLGQEAVAGYQAARQLAAQRFSLINENPAYKAVVDEGVQPDKFFQKYVESGNVASINNLKSLVGEDVTKTLQDTTVGRLKQKALNGASDERGEFSQAAYNKAINDPVYGPRLRALFSDQPETLGHIYRVGRVAEKAIKAPPGHSVNTSNTAPTAANMISDMAKSEAGRSIWHAVGRAITPARAQVLEQAAAQRAAQRANQAALNPGVTAAPLRALGSSQGSLSGLVTAAGAGAAARAAVKEPDE